MSLKIDCLSNCKGYKSYTEEIRFGSPLGAYSLGDGVLTLWDNGDGMLVRIYHIDRNRISKVLDIPTRGQYPEIFSYHGKLAVLVGSATIGEIMRNDEIARKMKTVESRGDIWQWNGVSYKLVP